MGHFSYPSLLFAWSDVKLYAEEESDSTFKMAVIAVLAPEHPLVHFYDYQSVEHFQKPQASLFELTTQHASRQECSVG